MNEPRQVPIGMFSRSVSRTHFTHPGVREILLRPIFHAALHAVISRILERVKLSPGQVRTALVRRLVRTIGTHCGARTGSKFAARFAPLVRTLLREAGANLSGGYQHGYHQWLPVRAVAKREVATLVARDGCHRKPTLCATHEAPVSTEVSTVSQCFSLVERRLAKTNPMNEAECRENDVE